MIKKNIKINIKTDSKRESDDENVKMKDKSVML